MDKKQQSKEQSSSLESKTNEFGEKSATAGEGSTSRKPGSKEDTHQAALHSDHDANLNDQLYYQLLNKGERVTRQRI